MDRALVVTLRWRQGDRATASRLATELVQAKPRRQLRREHPWTVAGVLVQAGFVLSELGETPTLLQAVERTLGLIQGAPMELPLRWQWCVLLASARRQEGNWAETDEILRTAEPHLDPGTCDLGLLERERARGSAARGDAAGAATSYARAAATFDAAGERWHAAETRAEAARVAGR